MAKRKAARQPIPLTDDSVAALPYATTGKGYAVHDSDPKYKGFHVWVGRKSKLLVYSGEHREPGGERRAIYRRLGDPAHVKVDEARARVHDERARLARWRDPDAKAGLTFGQAWSDPDDGYKARLQKKQRSERTIEDYTQKVRDHLKGFDRKALKDIRRSDVARLHQKLTDDVGPYCANGVLRVGHAIFKHAATRLEVPELGTNPFAAHDLNPEGARQTGMGERDLKGWFEKVMSLNSAIHRELQMFLLLTGLRRRDVTGMAWKDVGKDHIVIPNPKRKPSKDSSLPRIPITPPLRRVLDRVKRAAENVPPECADWVFPSMTSASHHIEEPKNAKLDRSPHALRHTFRNMCTGAKVVTIHSKLLMLHTINQEVHEAYSTPGAMFDQLAQAAGDVAAYTMRHLPKDAERRLLAVLDKAAAN
jgi:integrase